jgi:hypothetical protein
VGARRFALVSTTRYLQCTTYYLQLTTDPSCVRRAANTRMPSGERACYP